MRPQQPHLAQDRSTYIPPRIQQEMARHMEQTMPANLKYYQKSGGYVPPHIQQQMAQHMEQTMPNHLKQFINPYMQQKVVPQHLGPMPGGQSTQFTPPSHPLQTTFTQDRELMHAFDAQPQVGPQPQQTSPQTLDPQPVSSPQTPYAFITNPETTTKSSSPLLTLLSGKSLPIRIAIFGGGLIVLLIILNIAKGLVSGSFPLTPFVVVLQDQQELIHLTTNASQTQSGQALLPATYQNFLATTQLTVTSAQLQLLTYLAENRQQVPTKELSLKISSSVDSQLNNAIASSNYAATFQQIMTSQLQTYRADIRTAYTHTSGKKGHAQLSNEYAQARLLIKQLAQADSTPAN